MKTARKKRILFRCFEKPTAFRFAFVVLLAGCAAGAPPGTSPFALPFALMGDTPYSERDVPRLDSLIDDLNAQRLAFVVHIGDITSGQGPCGDAWLEARKKQFARIERPFILLPGDNDWTDCHRSGFDPMERLARWRALFCFPEKSFAEPKIRLERQAGDYCEHVRWEHEGMLFVALNVQGSNNNLGRTKAMDAEYEQRMAAVFEWLDESIAIAESRGAHRVVVLMHADPFLTHTPDGFANLRNVLAEHAKWLKGRLVLVHGDSHIYKDDEPLPGLRRVEVFGAPFVSWLRGSVVEGELRVESAAQH